jgi:hypothetical protein
LKIKTNFGLFPSVFVILRGRNQFEREFLALLSSSSDYCVIPRVDAYMLGYGEAVGDTITDMITRPPYITTLIGHSSFVDAPLITINEVSVGSLTVKNVDFIAYDIPQEARVDVILGKSFLERAKARIDYINRVVELEE